jgi:hypothetical protein
MKFIALIFFTFGFFVAGCNDQTKPSTEQKTDTTRKDFLPVQDFIRSEIAWVDSFPAKIVKYTIENGQKDSTIIDLKIFDSLAKDFLSPELEKPAFENNFTESSFMDQTSESLSFTYSALNNKTAIRRVDVLATPSLELDRVKSIYIEKTTDGVDGKGLKKMYWKSKSNFQIVWIMDNPNQSPSTRQLKVVWDNRQ